MANALNVSVADLLNPDDNPANAIKDAADLLQKYRNADDQGRAAIRGVTDAVSTYRHQGDDIVPLKRA